MLLNNINEHVIKAILLQYFDNLLLNVTGRKTGDLIFRRIDSKYKIKNYKS